MTDLTALVAECPGQFPTHPSSAEPVVVIERAADWDESLHPRDERGRFGHGGGGDEAASGGKEPAPKKPAESTSNKAVKASIEVAVKSMQQFAKESQGSLRERIVIMERATGKVLADIEQELELRNLEHVPTTGSGFTDADMFDAKRNYHPDGSILSLHTHPINQTFSDGDWRVFARSTIGEMRVVAPDSEFTLVKTKEFTDLPWQERTPAKINEAFGKHLDDVWDEFYKAGKDTDHDGIFAETTERMAKQFGVEYSVRSLSEAAPTGIGEAEILLVSEQPNAEKLDRWESTLTARSDALAAAGQAGNAEDTQIGEMQTALNKYQQELDANLKSGEAGLNAVYDGDMNLQAAAFTYLDTFGSYKSPTKVAIIANFGALNQKAGVKVLEQVTKAFADKADRIEATVWEDDAQTLATFEEAGYYVVDPGPGPHTSGRVTVAKTNLPGGGVAKQQETIRLRANAMAMKLDFNPSHIEYTDEDRDFTLGGQNYKYAGSYQRGEPTIKLYTRQINAESVKGITAHEIGHRKFEMLRNRLKVETEMMNQDPGPPPDPNHERWWGKRGGSDAMMTPTGELRPPYDEKYPIVHEWAVIQNMRPSLEQDDGITDYSKKYWAEWEKGTVKTDTAYHETMAEMSRNLGVMGKHSAVTGKGWRRLYGLQEKVWANTDEWMRDMSMNPDKANKP